MATTMQLTCDKFIITAAQQGTTFKRIRVDIKKRVAHAGRDNSIKAKKIFF
jgi:hypothetical protein